MGAAATAPSPPYAGSGLLTWAPLYVSVGVAGALVHMSLTLPSYGVAARLAACLMLAIFLRAMFSYARHTVVPPLLPLVTGQFYLLYGFAQLSQDSMFLAGYQLYVPDPSLLDTAAILSASSALTFWLGTAVGSFFTRRSFFPLWSVFPVPRREWSVPACVYSSVATTVRVALLILPEAVPESALNIILVVVNPNLGLVVVCFLAYRHRDARALVFAAVNLVVLVLCGAYAGVLEQVVVPLFMWFSASWMWGQRIRVRWLVVGLALFVFLSPAKYAYRQANLAGERRGDSLTLATSLDRWTEAIWATWFDPMVEGSIDKVAARTSGIVALAHGVDLVPRDIPHNHGEGFDTALLFFVPRVLWPDKPSITDLVNNRYALEFGLSDERGLERTTFALAQPLDGYWDFGVPGALAYPCLMGFFMAYVFLNPRERSIQAVAGLVFCGAFFQTLGALQQIVASLFSLLVGTYLALELMSRASATGRPPAAPSRR